MTDLITTLPSQHTTSSTLNNSSKQPHSLEIREWAVRILSAQTLEEKLFSPDILTDVNPGTPLFWDIPSRPPNMGFSKRSRKEKLPPFHLHEKEENRIVCLHRFAGHELLAVELMAYALVAYPYAPKSFRKGVAHTLKEEQEHVRLYTARLQECGVCFGDMPLYLHFWKMAQYLKTPEHYLSTLSLTFEMANLDFAPMYRDSFLKAGDTLSAALMQRIYTDEIGHVSFGCHWLSQMKSSDQSFWDSFTSNLPPILAPKRAKGFILNKEGRRLARVPEEWISEIEKL